MALATPPPAAHVLTYEEYLAEPETNLRYDIIDGVKHFMSNPSRRHQDVLANLLEAWRRFVRESRKGRVYLSPCDVKISHSPLRTRQPDLLFISNERLASNPHADNPAPLTPGPELVAEILSPSYDRYDIRERLADYAEVDVRECWLVSPQGGTVEVLRLEVGGYRTVEIYGIESTAQSVTFPDLTVKVAELFEE